MLSPFSPYSDPGFDDWQERLITLPATRLSIRRADPTIRDGQRMRWLQAECPPLFIQSIDDNVATISKQLVFIANIDATPIGFCIASIGRYDTNHLFIKRLGVVPPARLRGAGLGLLRAAADQEPRKNIAGATLTDDAAALALNAAFAASLGSVIQDVPRRRFRPTDLGLGPGESHRAWVIVRR